MPCFFMVLPDCYQRESGHSHFRIRVNEVLLKRSDYIFPFNLLPLTLFLPYGNFLPTHDPRANFRDMYPASRGVAMVRMIMTVPRALISGLMEFLSIPKILTGTV